MKNIHKHPLAYTIFLFSAIALSTLSLEFLLFHLSDYNVYRVLDISSQDFIVILSVLSVHYIVFRKIPTKITKLWKSTRLLKHRWIVLTAAVLLGFGVYSLLPTQLPVWIFFPLLASFIGFSVLANYFIQKPLKKAILLLLFVAGLDASLIFWMHEESNGLRRVHYASQLAERRDTIAEDHLHALARLDSTVVGHKDRQFWEKQWMNDAYLASNYHFNFQAQSASNIFHRPILTFDDEATAIYKLNFPSGQHLSFQLKKDFKRSVYTPNLPYKNLDHLRDYHFAVVDQREVVLANTHDFDLNIMDIALPAVGQSHKIEWNGFDISVYRHSGQNYVLIGEPLSEVQVWIANFAFVFSLLVVIIIGFEIFKTLFKRKNLYTFWQGLPIQLRIQTTLIGITLSLFFIIAATTFFFLQQNNLELAYERQLHTAQTVRKAVSEDKKTFSWQLTDFSVDWLAQLADQTGCDIDLYDRNGQLLNSSIASAENSPASPTVETDILKQLRKNPAAVVIQPFEKAEAQYLRSTLGIVENHRLKGFLSISTYKAEIGTAQDIPVIMSKLLNVYVLLLLVTWLVGLFLVHLLTHPLRLLAHRLGSFMPGHQNEKLDWAGHDAIGRLIQEYNKMVDVVEQSTKELARTEREDAWQIMAQQIAHEINNPLTTLKLNIQFLTRMLDTQQAVEPASAKRITDNLVDQIDNLSRIASQFKLFAKLEVPEARPLALNTFLEDFFVDYQQKTPLAYELEVDLTKDLDPTILIDAQHFGLVLQNMMTNAENAIAEVETGQIRVRTKVAKGKVIIEVEDNGQGIDPVTAERLFDPKFSINSSSSGLGLPICQRIVAFYDGQLSATSKSSGGTCFQIIFSAIDQPLLMSA